MAKECDILLEQELACKVCKKKVNSLKGLVAHVARAKNCKAEYGEEYEDLKKIQRKKTKQEYNQQNKERILKRQREYDKKNAESQKIKKRKYVKENADKVAVRQKNYNSLHAEKIKKTKSAYYKTHAEKIQKRQAVYNRENAEKIKEKAKDKRKSKEGTLKDFYNSISTGPVFPCVSCHRLFFLPGVRAFDELSSIEEKVGTELFKSSIKCTKKCLMNGRVHLCLNCWRTLLKGKQPVISVHNGLQLDEVPKELKITDLEQQLIAKVLLFMKIHKLPKSRMAAITDKVINVPLQDKDICDTLQALPRSPEDASLLTVKFKRMKSLKKSYSEAFIRPEAPEKALRALKKLGNKYYKFTEQSKEKMGPSNCDKILSDSSESEMSESDEEVLPEQQKQHASYNAVTCLVHDNPEAQVVINSSAKKLKKQTSPKYSIEIAPGEGKVPTNWLREEDFDAKAFPKHFPSGRFGCDYQRRLKLSKQKYFNQRVLNLDDRFRTDLTYIFAAQQRIEREQIERQFDIVLQRGQMNQATDGQNIISSKDSFAAFQKVRGTPKYFQTVRNEILAKVAQLGPFQLFFTLSCGEMRWGEVIKAILQLKGYQVQHESTNEIKIEGLLLDQFLEKQHLNKHDLLRENIFIVTRMFDNRVKQFIKHMVMSSKSKIQVEYYNYRVEFQMRGMAHIHGVMWLKKESLKVFYIPGTTDYDPEKVPNLIDELIMCSAAEEDEELSKIIEDVQVHRHTKSCKKYNGQCRFSFPRLPSKKTLIAVPIDKNLPEEARRKKMSHLRETLQKVQDVLNDPKLEEDMSIEKLLKTAGVSEEDYELALKTSERGSSVVLKRSVKDRNINNYNALYLKAWDANMDIQFCYDPYAVITYICDYYGKDDSGMTDLLKEALTKVKDKNQEDKLKTLKSVYLTHRQIGACEAIYRMLPSLHLKDSNVVCTFLGTGFPENRSVFMKRISCDDGDSDAEDEAGVQGIQIEGRQGRYQKSISVHDRYAQRPKALSQMCLAEFTVMYKMSYGRRKKVTFLENSTVEKRVIHIFGSERELPEQITFDATELGVMQLRTFPSVLRLHESKKKSDSHEYYYSEMLLFLPWRNEVQDLHRYDGEQCKLKFAKYFDSIVKRRQELFPYQDTIELTQAKLMDISLENVRPSHIYDTLDAEGTHQNIEDQQSKTDEACEEYAMLHPGTIDTMNDIEVPRYKQIDIDNPTELANLAQQLIPEQRDVFDKVVSFCKSVTRAWQTGEALPKAIRLIVHGGAGTGKSNLIRAVSKWAEKLLRKAGDHPHKPRVLLTAPTGMAASVIGGVTLHSALSFNFADELKPLSDKKLDEMRCSLADLKILVIDEMSMVRSDMLYQLHSRLCEIFQQNDLFGGVSVLLVGDLLQLKPVRGSYIFQPPRCQKYKHYYSINSLWEEFNVYILKHNHRQGQANKWACTLNRLRIGDTAVDADVLKNLAITEDEAKKKENACHIFYTNDEVDHHNHSMLNRENGELLSLKAVVTLPYGCKSSTDQHGRVDKTSFMRELNIKVGAKVMLIHNVNVLDNLTNGAMGIVVDMIKKGDHVECIMVKFDNANVGVEQRQRYQSQYQGFRDGSATPIHRTEFQYQLPRGRSGNLQHSATAKVLQFPLRLAWAVTAHKVQGQTFKKHSQIVVHWHKRFTEGMAYVMLGRCEDSSDVFITGQFSTASIRCNESAKQMSLLLEQRHLEMKNEWYNSDGGLKVILLNARSLRQHHLEIENTPFIQTADIQCFTETWLYPTEQISMNEEKKNSAFASMGPGKGCAVLTQLDMKSEAKVDQEIQILIVHAFNIQLVVVYRSSACSFTKLLGALNEVPFNKNTVILGDFNFDARDSGVVNTIAHQWSLKQIVTKSTHEKGNILDHVYVPTSLSDQVTVFLQPMHFSDHDCVGIHFKL